MTDRLIDLTQDEDCYTDLPAVAMSSTNISPSKKSVSESTAGEVLGKAKCSAVMKRKQVKLDEQKAMKVTAKKSKMYKKGECMKYMTIEVHPSLLGAWYMGDLQREASAKHTHVKAVSSMCDPSLVIFTRSREGAFEAPEQSTHGLYIMEASSVGEYVKNHTLSDHMKSIVDMSGCQLTLVVFGAKDYFKSTRKTTASKGTLMTEIDLMMALVDLLVSVECDNHLLDSSNDLALFIIQFTKAIAEAPFKKSQTMFDELAEFYMRGDKKTSVPIDSDGNGASQVWQQMLSVLPHSSLEIARAISGKYTGPANLAQVMETAGGAAQLAALGVARSAIPGARPRNLGPEFAARLCTLFTSTDGDLIVG